MPEKRRIPFGYPGTTNSGIYDAQAFSIGNSESVHAPASYPDGRTVIARCGAYGFTAETDTRFARWRDSEITCGRCSNA